MKKITKIQQSKIEAIISLYKINLLSLIGKIKQTPKRLTSFEKDDLLVAIRNYWIANPDLRLCQLLSNIAMGEDETRTDLYYYEDIYLLKALVKLTGNKKETLNEKHNRISKEARR